MKKVLLVDDNEKNRYLIHFILEKGGYKVIEAVDGESAVELALKVAPDLIIMDVKMPGIDGLEATRRIRESKAGNKMPILALTSYAMTGDEAKALNAGCTGYLTKPIDPKTFVSQIEKFLKRGSG